MPAHAQDSYDVGGYVKNLTSYCAATPTGYGFDELLHARLNTKWYINEILTGGMDARFRAYAGHTVRSTSQFESLIRNTHEFARVDAMLWSGAASVGYGEIDRLWLESMSGPWQITVGRQRIAWGTTLVWNIIDLFNPVNVLDFDYEERPGVDAARIQCYTSPVTNVDIVLKPGETGGTTTAAVKMTGNRWGYDFHLLAAANNNRWISGLAWAGDLWGAGFRGEALLTGINQDIRNVAGLDSGLAAGISAAVSLDYTFPSSLYLHAEGLFNKLGHTQSSALWRMQSLALGMRSPARWSAYAELTGDLSPLVRASIFGIINPTDASFVVAPTVTWSVATNLDAMLIALLFRGDPGTEFGGNGGTAYARVKWAF
jgi:hypothetical protein